MKRKPSDLTKILAFISLRPRSESEIRARLKRYQAENIESIIDSLKASKLIDDTRFASWYITSRVHSRPRGLRLLSAELRAKGVNDEIIHSLLSNELEAEALENLINKKSRSLSRDLLISYLQKHGFSYSKITRKLDEMGFSG